MKAKKILFLLFLLLLVVVCGYYFYPEKKLPAGVQIDSLVATKSAHELQAYSKGKFMKRYYISLGKQPVGAKETEGDNKTPEGKYFIYDKNPNSDYHKNLGVSYPDSLDVAKAAKMGTSAGGDIKIHGLRNGMGFIGKFQRWTNWTGGCMAVTNTEIDELYDAVKVGTPIEIKP